MMSDNTEIDLSPWFARFRKALLTGLAVVLPLTATVWVIGFLGAQLWKVGDWLLVRTARFALWITDRLVRVDWSIERFDDARIREAFFAWPGADVLRILLPLAMVAVIGVFALGGVWREWFLRLERRLERLPVLGLIYSSVKQLIEGFRGLGRQQNFKRVAYIEYPSPGCRLIGFVTGDYTDPDTGKAVTIVFVPTAPNPLTGFTVLVDSDKVADCGLGLEQALKMVITAGLVTPGSARKAETALAGDSDSPA